MSFDLHDQFRRDILKELHLTLVRAYGKDYNLSSDYPTRLQPVFSKLYQYFNMGGAYDSRLAVDIVEEKEETQPEIKQDSTRAVMLTCSHCHHPDIYRIHPTTFGVNCRKCHQSIFLV